MIITSWIHSGICHKLIWKQTQARFIKCFTWVEKIYKCHNIMGLAQQDEELIYIGI